MTSYWTLSSFCFLLDPSHNESFFYLLYMSPDPPSLHGHGGEVLVSQQALTSPTSPRVASSVAVAAIFLKVLAQGDEGRAQAGAVGRQDPPRQLDEHRGRSPHS